MRRSIVMLLVVALLLVFAAPFAAAGTTVPGHSTDRYDMDGNGISDAGVFVTGHYNSVYAYDNLGDWYWDLGDGRIYGTVGSIDDLDGATLSVCDYQVNYRADFGNDPYMDTGWIINAITCTGFDGPGSYTYLIVHEDDPKFRGTGIPVWNTWEYLVLTESGSGNQVRPWGT